MKCLRCDEEKDLFVTATAIQAGGLAIIGFCLDCWKEVNKAGYCVHCGVGEDLFIHAMWHGRIIEHICGHCRAIKG